MSRRRTRSQNATLDQRTSGPSSGQNKPPSRPLTNPENACYALAVIQTLYINPYFRRELKKCGESPETTSNIKNAESSHDELIRVLLTAFGDLDQTNPGQEHYLSDVFTWMTNRTNYSVSVEDDPSLFFQFIVQKLLDGGFSENVFGGNWVHTRSGGCICPEQEKKHNVPFTLIQLEVPKPYNPQRALSLDQLLKKFLQPSTTEATQCSDCKELYKCESTKITKLNKILTICLPRTLTNSKGEQVCTKKRFSFQKSLDSQQLVPTQNNELYELFAVINIVISTVVSILLLMSWTGDQRNGSYVMMGRRWKK